MKRTSVLVLLWLGLGCGSGSSTGADAGGANCVGDMPCGSDQICVQTTVSGGACSPKMGASCPAGTVETTCPGGQAGCVTRSTRFECKPRPSQCAQITCDCAVPILCGQSCSCARASEAELACVCNAP